jgi:N-methylhydantoinase B
MSKDMIEGIPAGTVYHQIASGGGGYGKPEERKREKVLKDVRDEVVSSEQAKEIYKITLAER